VVVGPGAGVVGLGLGAAAVVGGWTAGSDFSPQPAAARAAIAAVASTSDRSRRLPAEPWNLTAGTVTKPAPAYAYASEKAGSPRISSSSSAYCSAALSSGWITSAATAIAATTRPAATQKAR
jgi:hypothetical protein